MKRYFSLFVSTCYTLILASCSTFNGNHIDNKTINISKTFQHKTSIGHLSDDFNDAANLSDWKLLSKKANHPARHKYLDINDRSRSHLYLEPFPAAWYEGYQGFYLYKNVTGNFVVSTRIKIKGKFQDFPSKIWSLAGLMVREPDELRKTDTDNHENWIYLMTGRGPKDGLVVDWKSTRNNKNYWTLEPRRPGWIQLAMIRTESLFTYAYKYDEGDWIIGNRKFIRDDLPDELQIGLCATADIMKTVEFSYKEYNSTEFTNETDLEVYWDHYHIKRPALSDGITQKVVNRNFWEITNSEILSML